MTIDSAIPYKEWKKFEEFIKEAFHQAACDYAAACTDDKYDTDFSSALLVEYPSDKEAS